MKTIIGLIGLKESGKSTIAAMLKELGYVEYALAGKLKQVCASTFSVPVSHFTEQSLKEMEFGTTKFLTINKIHKIVNDFGIPLTEAEVIKNHGSILGKPLRTPREIAQIVGTEILRHYSKDIHCDSLTLDSEKSVISDIRFPNELEYFSNKDDVKFISLYVDRGLVNEDLHASEALVESLAEKSSAILENKSSIMALEGKLISVLKHMGV